MISANLNVIVLKIGFFIEFLFVSILFPETGTLLGAPAQKYLRDFVANEANRFIF
jgi:hypothetical protein